MRSEKRLSLNVKLERTLAIPVFHCAPTAHIATTIKAWPEPEHQQWQDDLRVLQSQA